MQSKCTYLSPPRPTSSSCLRDLPIPETEPAGIHEHDRPRLKVPSLQASLFVLSQSAASRFCTKGRGGPVPINRLQEKGRGGKMALIVGEAVPAGMKPPAVDDGMRNSTGGKFGFSASAPLLISASPMHFAGATKRVQLPCESWSNSSSSHRPGQKSHPRTLLDLLQHPPYAYESWCMVLHLPPWRNIAAKLDTADLPNVDLSLSSSQ